MPGRFVGACRVLRSPNWQAGSEARGLDYSRRIYRVSLIGSIGCRPYGEKGMKNRVCHRVKAYERFRFGKWENVREHTRCCN